MYFKFSTLLIINIFSGKITMFSKKDKTILEGLMILGSIKKHATKAATAKALNTSADTLNKYLSYLETEFNTKLVSTTERGCSLTPDGIKLAELADQLKNCLYQIYAAQTSQTDTLSGEIRIAYDKDIRCNLQTRKIQEFYSSYPGVSIIADTYDNTPDIAHLGYDICLSCGIPPGNDIVIIASRQITCGYFASAYYLATHTLPRDEEDIFKNHRLILKKDYWNRIENNNKLLGSSAYKPFVSNSTIILTELVANSCGIAVMPLYFARNCPGLVHLEHIKCAAFVTIYLTSQRFIKDIPKVRTALDYYKQLFKNLA